MLPKGIARAEWMRRWAETKGGFAAAPDGLDRRDHGTLASQADTWVRWMEERAYSPASLETRAIFVAPSKKARALWCSRTGAADVPVVEGREITVWHVACNEAARDTFQRDGERETLLMYTV